MQPQYAPPPQPQYPVQPGYPPQPQYAPAYPPQYAPPMPPPPPPVQGSLSEFFNAPSTANKSWVFRDRPVGTAYSGIVARVIGNGDIRQQTDQGGRPMTYKDGRPKFVMVVPMIVHPSPEHPEGQASWWVKGQARDELARAMAEAGAPEGPPEAGAGITVTLIGQRPIPGMNPAFQYRVTYVRPGGAAPVPQAQPAPAVPQAEPVYVAPPQPQYAPQPYPSHTPGMDGQPVPTLPIAQTVTPPVPPNAYAAAAMPSQVSPQLTPEQAALMARLTGQAG